MSWREEMVPILRHLVGDVDVITYSDTRLEEVIIVAAQLVNTDISFNITYSVDVDKFDIVPDPTVDRDDNFINFVVLKAACLSDISTYRTKALAAGIKVRLGPAQLDTTYHLKGFSDLLDKGPCKLYDDLKMQYRFGNPYVHAILSAFVHSDFDPIAHLSQNTDSRDLFT